MCHCLIFISNFGHSIGCLFDEEPDLVMVQWVQTQSLLTVHPAVVVVGGGRCRLFDFRFEGNVIAMT